MNNKWYFVIGVALIALGCKGISVSSMRSLYRSIEKRNLAVLMVYKSDKQQRKDNQELYNSIKHAKKEFSSLQSIRDYKKVNMAFIDANITHKDMAGFSDDFGLEVNQEPIYLLFINGKLVKKRSGAPALANGFLSVNALRTFIDTYMQDAMEDYLDDKEEKERRERARADFYLGFGGGYPWFGGYPYYGGWWGPYGGYGYGGRVGFGFGFGF